MGVYVNGMKMPETCRSCSYFGQLFNLLGVEYVYCGLLETKIEIADAIAGRHTNCPLAEIPDRHRELIDRNDTINKLRAELKSNCDSSADWFDGFCSAMNYIKSSPTLIEGGKK